MVQSPDEQLADARAVHQANRFVTREAHVQKLTQADAALPQTFRSTQFIAYVDPSSFKLDRFGSMHVSFRIPNEWRERVMPLLDAPGVLLSVDVQRWEAVPSEPDV